MKKNGIRGIWENDTIKRRYVKTVIMIEFENEKQMNNDKRIIIIEYH